jgi:hypothetical protein
MGGGPHREGVSHYPWPTTRLLHERGELGVDRVGRLQVCGLEDLADLLLRQKARAVLVEELEDERHLLLLLHVDEVEQPQDELLQQPHKRAEYV